MNLYDLAYTGQGKYAPENYFEQATSNGRF